MIADWIKFPSRYVRTRLYCTTYLLVPIINTYSLKQAQNIQTEIYLHKYLSLLYRYVDILWVRTYGTIGPSHHCIVFLFVDQTLAVALLHLSRITPMLHLSTTLFCYWLPLLGAASSTACLAVGVHCSGTWKTSASFHPPSSAPPTRQANHELSFHPVPASTVLIIQSSPPCKLWIEQEDWLELLCLLCWTISFPRSRHHPGGILSLVLIRRTNQTKMNVSISRQR